MDGLDGLDGEFVVLVADAGSTVAAGVTTGCGRAAADCKEMNLAQCLRRVAPD